MWVFVITFVLSLFLGYAIARNRLCLLLAATQAWNQTSLTLYAAFGIVVAAAAVVVVPLAWVPASWILLPRAVIITGPLLAGAAIAGLGVFVNGACPMGTLTRIGLGEFQYLCTLVGLAVGFVILDATHFLPAVAGVSERSDAPLATGIAALIAFGCLYWFSDQYLARQAGAPHRLLRIMMPILGVAGAVLFCLSPNPSYGDAIRSLVAPTPTTLMTRLGGGLVGSAAIIGALLVAFTGGTFAFRRPSAIGVVRCLLGGAVMAVGGKLMGAGGEKVMLVGAPSGAPSGVVSLVAMTITIFGLVGLSRLMSSPTRSRP